LRERRTAAEQRKRRTGGGKERASVQHERPDPLDEEEVSDGRRQTNCAAAFVSALGYRVWLARVVNAIMRASTSCNRNEP
jgi:hypothetical protein